MHKVTLGRREEGPENRVDQGTVAYLKLFMQKPTEKPLKVIISHWIFLGRAKELLCTQKVGRVTLPG